MANILETITNGKYKEVAEKKALFPTHQLEKSALWERNPIRLTDALQNSTHYGIIAEFKRKSPSKGIFNESFDPSVITPGYIASGAAALSVLTDTPYFGGTEKDLITARALNNVPILRKDFIVDEYQIVEAKSWGADVILLIAAAIPPLLLNKLARFTHSLGLQTILEIHEIDELHNNLSDYIDIVGVNNRNLKDFTVDIHRSEQAVQHIPSQFVKISESGLSQPDVVKHLAQCGYKGFLMGEAFMQSADPVASCHSFIKQLSPQ